MIQPLYLAYTKEHLAAKAREAVALLVECRLCPRDCGARRLDGETGVCGTGRHARVATAFEHHGEEEVLRGTRGSGTIFLAQCNLHCLFCVNHDISHGPAGNETDAGALADLMLALQTRGCHNINLVTPSHVVPQILEALSLAAPRGLRIPLVYNSSGYDRVETLRLLDGIVDVYLPDFKFWEAETGKALTGTLDYPDRAREAVMEMHRQVGDLKTGPDGLATRGLLVRHLVMPGHLNETREILEWLARDISKDTIVNLMGQYSAEYRAGEKDTDGRPLHPDIARRPTPREIERANGYARKAGLTRFIPAVLRDEPR